MNTCRVCSFAKIQFDKIICSKREYDGVIVEIDIKHIDIPCPARNAEEYNEKYERDTTTSNNRERKYRLKEVRYMANGKKDRNKNYWEIYNKKEEGKKVDYITSQQGGDMSDIYKKIKNVKINT